MGSEKEEVALDEDKAESEWVKRRRRQHRGAHSLPPVQSGGRALLLQLKGLREALPPGQVEVEGGGARALWRTMFSANKKEKKRRGRTLPPERLKKEMVDQRRATGDDVINTHSDKVMSL